MEKLCIEFGMGEPNPRRRFGRFEHYAGKLICIVDLDTNQLASVEITGGCVLSNSLKLHDLLTSAAYDLIKTERQKQIKKGFDARHDDQHDDFELVQAAIDILQSKDNHCGFHSQDPLRRAVVAAALLVAEIEKLQRAKWLKQVKSPQVQELEDNTGPDKPLSLSLEEAAEQAKFADLARAAATAQSLQKMADAKANHMDKLVEQFSSSYKCSLHKMADAKKKMQVDRDVAIDALVDNAKEMLTNIAKFLKG